MALGPITPSITRGPISPVRHDSLTGFASASVTSTTARTERAYVDWRGVSSFITASDIPAIWEAGNQGFPDLPGQRPQHGGINHRQALSALLFLYGEHRLMSRLCYGAGLLLMECIRLRVKDIDFARGKIVVRSGKGGKDRVTMLPRLLHQGFMVPGIARAQPLDGFALRHWAPPSCLRANSSNAPWRAPLLERPSPSGPR